MEDYVYFIGLPIAVFIIFISVKSMIFVTKKFGFNYAIRFEKVETIPDLQPNRKFRRYFRVVSHPTECTYTVQSKWNDKQLIENISEEYHLENNQIIVQPLQLSGVLGFI